MNQQIVEKMENMQNMQSSMEYLKRFQKQQMEMFEAADRAYAQKVFEEEELKLNQIMSKRREQEALDAELARKYNEELNERAQKREEMNQKLNIQRHIRSSSVEDSDGLVRKSTVRSTGRKKFASTVNVGERVKLHNGFKGVARFVGQVHFMKKTMVGLELTDGEGDNDGSKNGQRYFNCNPGVGKFVTFEEISHVYKIRKDNGKEEKQRFRNNQQVNEAMGNIDSSDTFTSSPTQQTYTQRQLDRMTTDAQIEILMQMSQAPARNQVQPARRHQDIRISKSNTQRSRKEKFRRTENQRLMREASVQILNELIDAIDSEDQKQMVLNDFVRNRSSSPVFGQQIFDLVE